MIGQISDELLHQAYQAAARIVADHGPKYLPVFERMHKEVEARNSSNNLLNLAMCVASTNG